MTRTNWKDKAVKYEKLADILRNHLADCETQRDTFRDDAGKLVARNTQLHRDLNRQLHYSDILGTELKRQTNAGYWDRLLCAIFGVAP